MRGEGIAFAPAPEYQVFPQGPEPLDFYEAVVHATRDTLPLVRELAPEVVVADILTLAPALAGELDGRPVATLIPHVYPHGRPEHPIYSLGARMPRTSAGRELWRRVQPIVQSGLQRGRRELNETRSRMGLAPLDRVHGGISPDLAIVATYPQLEYPRVWPPGVHVVGPLMWEPPAEGGDDLADAFQEGGQRPLVLVAPSTAQDAEHRMLRAALLGLADAAGEGPGNVQPAPAAAAAAGSRERQGRRLDRLLARDAACGCSRLPCRARHARAGTFLRVRGRRLPRRGGHERERRAAGLGRGGRQGTAPLPRPADAATRRRARARGALDQGPGRRDRGVVADARPRR